MFKWEPASSGFNLQCTGIWRGDCVSPFLGNCKALQARGRCNNNIRLPRGKELHFSVEIIHLFFSSVLQIFYWGCSAQKSYCLVHFEFWCWFARKMFVEGKHRAWETLWWWIRTLYWTQLKNAQAPDLLPGLSWGFSNDECKWKGKKTSKVSLKQPANHILPLLCHRFLFSTAKLLGKEHSWDVPLVASHCSSQWQWEAQKEHPRRKEGHRLLNRATPA